MLLFPRHLVFTLLIGVGPALITCGCGGEPGGGQRAAKAPAPVQVGLSPVQVRPLQRNIDVTGTLFGDEETVISAELSGRVVEILADVGDQVGPGAVLTRIDRRDYELALTERRTGVLEALARIGLTQLPSDDFDPSGVPTVIRARAEAANAAARLERARRLFEQIPPLLSEQDFADIQTAGEVAASGAEVELLTARAVLAEARTRAAEAAVAEQRLADTELRVPGRGGEGGPRYEVAERLVSVGEFVTEGRPAFRLVASDLIKFRADVPERFAGQVVTGQGAQVWVEAYPDPVVGRVARVSPRIDPASRTYQIEIHVENADGRLKPGGFARGSVAVRMEEGVTMVPEAAVVSFAGVQKVFGVKDGKAAEKRVRTGVKEGGLVEIVGGLKVEAVVTTGAAGLAEGTPVSVPAE